MPTQPLSNNPNSQPNNNTVPKLDLIEGGAKEVLGPPNQTELDGFFRIMTRYDSTPSVPAKDRVLVFKKAIGLWERCGTDTFGIRVGASDPLEELKNQITHADNSHRSIQAFVGPSQKIYEQSPAVIALTFVNDFITRLQASKIDPFGPHSASQIDQMILTSRLMMLRASRAVPDDECVQSVAQGGSSITSIKGDQKGPKLRDRSKDWQADRLKQTEERKAALKAGGSIPGFKPKAAPTDEQIMASDQRAQLAKGHIEMMREAKPLPNQEQLFKQRHPKELRKTLPNAADLDDSQLDKLRAATALGIADTLKSWLTSEIGFLKVTSSSINVENIVRVESDAKARLEKLESKLATLVEQGNKLGEVMAKVAGHIKGDNAAFSLLSKQDQAIVEKILAPKKVIETYELAD